MGIGQSGCHEAYKPKTLKQKVLFGLLVIVIAPFYLLWKVLEWLLFKVDR